MKSFLQARSNRWTHDGWAIKVKGSSHPMPWTVCTTREEARQLKIDRFKEDDLFGKLEIVKIKIEVREV
jgi:hypothetical protein